MADVEVSTTRSADRFEVLAELGRIEKRKPRAYKGGEEVRVELVRNRDNEHPDPSVAVHGWVTPASDMTARGKNGQRPYTGPTRGGGFGWLSLSEAERLCELLAQAVVEGYSIIERAEAGAVGADA